MVEIVDLEVKNGDFPVRYVCLLEGMWIRIRGGFLKWGYPKIMNHFSIETHGFGDPQF
jgi:hypothetical protein